LQAPFRAGIRLDAYRLLPLRQALRPPRVNLLIADDVGQYGLLKRCFPRHPEDAKSAPKSRVRHATQCSRHLEPSMEEVSMLSRAPAKRDSLA
jgi:hypothetical protein